MSYKEDIQKQITEHNRRLQILKEKQARMGYNTPPEIITEIKDIEAQVEELEEELRVVSEAKEKIKETLCLQLQNNYCCWGCTMRKARLSFLPQLPYLMV